MNQEIKLIKKNGEEIGVFKASVQKNKIFTFDKIPVVINKGDYFFHKNVLGQEEKLIVSRSHVCDKKGIFSHIEIDYRK